MTQDPAIPDDPEDEPDWEVVDDDSDDDPPEDAGTDGVEGDPG